MTSAVAGIVSKKDLACFQSVDSETSDLRHTAHGI